MNQSIDFIERKIPTSDRMLWKMKVFRNSYTQELQDFPGFPDGLKNGKAVPSSHKEPSFLIPPHPQRVCYTCSSNSQVWKMYSLNQMLHISGKGRSVLHERARTEERRSCNSNLLNGTTYQENDFTCSWIKIQVCPKSSDFHSWKDQSDKKWSWRNRHGQPEWHHQTLLKSPP